MKILLVCGEHQYGDPSRGEAYEFTNFLPSLIRLGHEVLHFESFNKSKYSDAVDMNRQFLQTAQSFKPDVIFCVLMAYEIWIETLLLAKKMSGAALVHWSTDDSWKYEEFSQWIAPVFDRYITTYTSAIEKAKKAGWHHFMLSQWAANAEHAKKPMHSKDCKYDVSFVGMAYGDRKKWMAELEKKNIHVNCFGFGWPNGPVNAEKMLEIIRQSRLTLNFTEGSKRWHGLRRITEQQIKARLFEVPGAGGCLLTENTPELKKYYDLGEEIFTFKDIESCVATIEFLLSHSEERDRVALKGYEKTLKIHTYDQRFNLIFDNLKKTTAVISEQEAWACFMELEQAHLNFNFWVPAIRWYEKCCRMIFGDFKGKKAARRIFFECYWRVCGLKTYSAKGLTSKCFFWN